MKYQEAVTEEYILDLFKKSGALLNGHFKLSSGFHSKIYLQCAKIMQYPEINSLLSSLIAEKFKNEKINVVVGPALGGVILAYETGRKLNCRTIFAERVLKDDQKIMTFRRGFEIEPGEKILITEDVITTGGSVKEVIELCTQNKAEVIGVAGIVDRTNGQVKLHNNQFFILKMDVEKYDPKDCPLCKDNIVIDSPGSKYI